MKKMFSLILLFYYFVCTNFCCAISHLYFLKNTNKTVVKPIIENNYSKKKYTLSKKDPYFGLLEKNNNKNATIILQTSGKNLFYYYNSNDSNGLNNDNLKKFKENNIVYEESFNEDYISSFENQLDKVINNSSKTVYDFENQTNSVEATPITTTVKKKDDSTLRGGVVQVAKGEKFSATLQTPINTANANVNDEVTAVLSKDWVIDGKTIAKEGSILKGYLSKARHATYGSVNGRIVMNFNQLTTTDDRTYKLSADKIDITVSNDGKLVKTVRNVAVSAATGAIVGLLIGIATNDIGRGAALGAGIAGGTALVSSGVQQGVDAEIPVYTELELELKQPLNVILNY